MSKKKYIEVAEIIEKRIADKIYSSSNLPSERKLSTQLGASYLTVRKAVQSLINEGALQRNTTNGRLSAGSTSSKRNRQLNIGFLMPPSIWAAQHSWLYEVTELVKEKKGVLRPITYFNVSDPVIFEALDGDFDGLFVVLPPEIPGLLMDRLEKNRRRIVVLWEDLTHLGIPSIENAPPRFVGKLLDHLTSLGHTRIDCMNTQKVSSVMRERIEHWNLGIEKRKLYGRLHYCLPRPFVPGLEPVRDFVASLIDDGSLNKTSALFCVTTSQAWAAIRACQDRGLKVGRDISICGFGEMDIARMLMPTVTAVQPADRRPFLSMGLEWIETQGKNWSRPLRLEPEDVELFIGESTGPAPKPGKASKGRN